MLGILAVAAGDELGAGVCVVGAPALGEDLAIGGPLALLAGLFTIPMVLGLVVEPVVLAWTDRLDRRRVLRWTLGLTSLSLLAMAASPSLPALSVAVAVWGAASGVSLGVAEALVLARGPTPERAMSRWMTAGTLGDVGAPLLLAATGSWRVALVWAAALPLVGAAAATVHVEPEAEDEVPGLGEALAAAWGRGLLGVTVAVGLCCLLDELLLVLVALRLGADEWTGVVALTLGTVAGARFADVGLVHFSPRRVLGVGAAVAAVSLSTFATVPTGPTSPMVLAALGAGAAVMWPIAQATLYRTLPGRPGLAAAVERLTWPIEAGAPLLVGAVVANLGVGAGLLLLLVQPLGVVLLLWRRAHPR